MITPSLTGIHSRRVYIFALVASASIVVLLLLHHNVDRLPFGSAQVWEEPIPEPVLARVLPVCHAPDPFEAEYGRTNLRLTRAYEGKIKGQSGLLTSGSLHRLQQFIRKALAGPEVTVSVIGGSSE